MVIRIGSFSPPGEGVIWTFESGGTVVLYASSTVEANSTGDALCAIFLVHNAKHIKQPVMLWYSWANTLPLSFTDIKQPNPYA